MVTQTIYKNFEELRQEITNRDYNNILGLKCRITAKDYNYFLEVLPPFNWINEFPNSSFILSECLSGNLYYKFSRVKENMKLVYYCEIVEYKPSREEY